jgi:hypothetical protein
VQGEVGVGEKSAKKARTNHGYEDNK